MSSNKMSVSIDNGISFFYVKGVSTTPDNSVSKITDINDKKYLINTEDIILKIDLGNSKSAIIKLKDVVHNTNRK